MSFPPFPAVTEIVEPVSAPFPVQPEPEPAPPPIPVQGGLVPLDQPISLDDLVSGGRAAGPFLSPELPKPDTPAWPTAEDLAPLTQSNGDGASLSHTEFSPLVLPKREPKFVAPEEQAAPSLPEPEPPASALEDDVPTRRLPIYQSVLSRWFSEGEEESGAAELPPADTAGEALPPLPPLPPMDSGEPVPEPVEVPEARPEPKPKPRLLPPDDGWRSAADDGWQAAQSLLESKNEEITSAGLPKRIPNAYLVPGSISAPAAEPGPSSFADATAGLPGTGAIARSASAARHRMASFQRGYTSGRHALKELPADQLASEGVAVSGRYPAEESSEEHK